MTPALDVGRLLEWVGVLDLSYSLWLITDTNFEVLNVDLGGSFPVP